MSEDTIIAISAKSLRIIPGVRRNVISSRGAGYKASPLYPYAVFSILPSLSLTPTHHILSIFPFPLIRYIPFLLLSPRPYIHIFCLSFWPTFFRTFRRIPATHFRPLVFIIQIITSNFLHYIAQNIRPL